MKDSDKTHIIYNNNGRHNKGDKTQDKIIKIGYQKLIVIGISESAFADDLANN